MHRWPKVINKFHRTALGSWRSNKSEGIFSFMTGFRFCASCMTPELYRYKASVGPSQVSTRKSSNIRSSSSAFKLFTNKPNPSLPSSNHNFCYTTQIPNKVFLIFHLCRVVCEKLLVAFVAVWTEKGTENNKKDIFHVGWEDFSFIFRLIVGFEIYGAPLSENLLASSQIYAKLFEKR